MDLEIRHLKLIYFVAQEGSLTKAAKHLHLTQPALSHQLRDLEERLDTLLFHRLGKTMQLTAAGRRLLRTARQVLDLLQEAEDDVHRIAAGQAGTIRISTQCYTCYHWLPPIIECFRQDFPQVAVDINAEVTHYPLQALLEGTIDLAIVSSPIEDARLRYRSLFQDEKVALMPPDHPLAQRSFLEAADFADEHLILYSGETSSTLQSFVYAAGVRPRRISEVQVTEGILELVKAGLGITVLARWAAVPELEAGTLRAVRLTEQGFHRQWSAATLNGDTTPSFMGTFMDLLATYPISSLHIGADCAV